MNPINSFRFKWWASALPLLVTCTFSSLAADRYWAPSSCNPSAGGAGTWSDTATVWSPNSTGGGCVSWVNANSDSAYFLGTASYVVTLSGNKTVNKIYRVASGANVNLSGSVTITFAGTGAGVQSETGGYVTLSCNFAGTLTKTGAGRLEANNANNNSKWVINAGYVSFAAANRFGSATGNDFLTFDGGGLGIGWSSTGTSKTLVSNKGITIKAGGAFFGASAQSNDLRIESPVIDGSGGTGNGGLNVTTGSPLAYPYSAGGVVILANTTSTANSYKGPTSVASNCKIVLGAHNQIPDDSVLTLATGGTVDFAGYSDTVKSVSGTGGTLNLGTGTLTINDPAGESYTSALNGSAGSKVIKKGSGAWSCTGTASSWDAELQAGTWFLGGVNGLGANNVVLKGGTVASTSTAARLVRASTVSLQGNVTLGHPSNTGNLTFTNYWTGSPELTPWTISGGNRQITVDTITATIGSVGQDAAGRALTKAGSGTLMLGGLNTYSGNTTVSAGTLKLGASGSIANSPVISVASGATFDVSAVSSFAIGTAQTLTGNGTVVGSVAINGTVAPGASVGTLTTGAETWNGGGKYVWEINDADTAGGWDKLNAGANAINVAADSGNKFTLELKTLSGSSPGPAADFDPDQNYTWQIAAAGSVQNFAASDFTINDAGFVNDLKGGTFAVEADANGINLKFLRNQAPVATTRNVPRPLGATVKIKVADLLAENTSDPDGDARELVNVGLDTPPSAGTVSVANGFIFYVPTDVNSASSDSFSFKVKDVRVYRSGDTVRTAVGSIQIATVTAVGGQVGPIDTSGGAVTVNFSGIPGYRYDVERSVDLATWEVVDTITAPSNGQFSFQDTNPPQPAAYYRLKYNPPTP